MKGPSGLITFDQTFNPAVISGVENFDYPEELWPVVYMLSNAKLKEAYVGETTDAFSRMNSHLRDDQKSTFTNLKIFTNDLFNKSAALDIESNLIKYVAGDGNYKLTNANLGLANHNYYHKKEVYWDVFRTIWQKLKKDGFARQTLQQIDNSDIFKYSPYKSLSPDQRENLIIIIKSILRDKDHTIVVQGGAGTGKTVLAAFLFKLLHTDIEAINFREFEDDELPFVDLVSQLKHKYPNPRTALVVPMQSFRNTMKKVFRNVKGLNAKMVIGPSELAGKKFDIVLVDESHRLRRRVNLGSYFGIFDKVCRQLGLDKATKSELDWVLLQAKTKVLFYDDGQSIKPSDVRRTAFDELKRKKNTVVETLTSQFRLRGGRDYVNYVQKLLTCEIRSNEKPYSSRRYELKLFNSIDSMVNAIKVRNEEFGLARLVAGYSWKWISKKNASALDIDIDGKKLRWNSTSDDWVNSENAINEVGCIHTTQGYDLNYAGVIFGNEITYDEQHEEIKILKDNYYDANGKNSITDPDELKRFIINIYSTIMMRGIRGTYVFVCDPALRKYFRRHISAARF